MNTKTLTLAGDTTDLASITAVLDAIFSNAVVAALVTSDDPIVLVLEDASTISLTIDAAVALSATLTKFGYNDDAAVLDVALSYYADHVEVAPEPTPRWDVQVIGTCTHGHRFTGTFAVDEVSDLHDIIEKGPCFGPGYKVKLELTYTA